MIPDFDELTVAQYKAIDKDFWENLASLEKKIKALEAKKTELVNKQQASCAHPPDLVLSCSQYGAWKEYCGNLYLCLNCGMHDCYTFYSRLLKPSKKNENSYLTEKLWYAWRRGKSVDKFIKDKE